MRLFLSTLIERLLQRQFLIGAVVFFALGAAAGFAFKHAIPSRPEAPPLAGIAATTLLLLLTQAATLGLLGLESSAHQRWPSLLAFIKAAKLSAAGHIGIAVAGVVHSIGMLATSWAMCVAFAGILCALHSITTLVVARRTLAIQSVLLIAVLLNSALFWSRAIITDSGVQSMADGVMKLSPPLALSAAWHQEGSSLRNGREDSRFDIIRSPLTYDIWVGSYQAVPYPPVFPQRESGEPFQAGLLLTLLLWGVPVLVFSEVLARKPVAAEKTQ